VDVVEFLLRKRNLACGALLERAVEHPREDGAVEGEERLVEVE